MEAKVGAGAEAEGGTLLPLSEISCISTSLDFAETEGSLEEAVVVAVPPTEVPPAEAGRSL
jgi:hypothetical protein